MEQIFLPLLRKWDHLYQLLGRRVIIFLSAPPGVGKTTAARFLEYLSKEEAEMENLQAIGLDGFHYHQDYILTHDAVVNGEKVPMKNVKGCPETFDIEKLIVKIRELKKGSVKWPVYDRNIHDVVEDAVAVTARIVLIEGNWLLSNEGCWRPLIELCDDSIFITTSEKFLEERLINRKMKGGPSLEAAREFYEYSDRKNFYRMDSQ